MSTLKYRPDIDGLRAIAVLSVVLFHFFPSIAPGGFSGVDIFFVISGYLISNIIFKHLEEGTFSFSSFYARRINRLFPTLILILVSCNLFGWFYLFADEFTKLGKHTAAGAGFISNLIYWSERGYFDHSSLSKPLLHLWSLGIEEQFYIVWPFLMWISWKKKLKPIVVILFLIFFSFIWNLVSIYGVSGNAYYSPFTRFWELLSGCLLACSMPREEKKWSKSILDIFSVVGLGFLIFGFTWIKGEGDFPGFWALLPVVGTMLLIYAGQDAWINKFLSHKLAVGIGLISYPLYMWHWPLLTLEHLIHMTEQSVSLRLLLIMMSLILSWLTYRFVETPVRSYPFRKKMALILSCLMAIVGIFGWLSYREKGFKLRQVAQLPNEFYAPEAKQMEKDFVLQFEKYNLRDVTKTTKPIVLIIGDSFQSRWSTALVSHLDTKKFEVISIKYFGCNVEVKDNEVLAQAKTKDYKGSCGKFSQVVNDSTLAKRITAVMLVSHRPFTYLANSFRFKVIQWVKERSNNFELFIFGNYFQLDEFLYPSCLKLMTRMRQDARICLKTANYPSALLDRDSVVHYPLDGKFKVIDIIKLHCGYDKVGCATEYKGVPFMTDWHHLTATFIDGLLTDIRKRKFKELQEIGLTKYLNSDL